MVLLSVSVSMQVEKQIKSNRLAFKENSFLDDAALRKKAVRAIMSYHPLWLRLGIDTVLNRRTFQEGDLDNINIVSSADLEAVVREELLSDSTLLVCPMMFQSFTTASVCQPLKKGRWICSCTAHVCFHTCYFSFSQTASADTCREEHL